MGDSEEITSDRQIPVWLRIVLGALGIGVPAVVLIWTTVFQETGESDRHATDIALLQSPTATLTAVSQAPTSTKTPTPSPTATATSTPTRTPTATRHPFSSTGNCDSLGVKPPCSEFSVTSWEDLGKKHFGGIEACRWVEVANINRDANGRYLLPLVLPVIRPPIAPAGTYAPMRLNAKTGSLEPIQPCTGTSGKPCNYQVDRLMVNTLVNVFEAIANEGAVYGFSSRVIVQTLADQNRDSRCRWKSWRWDSSITLQPGDWILIPREADEQVDLSFWEGYD